MEICITARHGSISDDAFSMIQQKVEKLARFYDRVSSIEVMVDLPRKGESGVEMKLCADKATTFLLAAPATTSCQRSKASCKNWSNNSENTRNDS